MEFNNMNLDELLNMSSDNTMTGKLFTCRSYSYKGV